MRNLIIDPEFRDKIPPLSAEEFAKLEENILADGEVREPLVCWNNTIIDGHHRWKIIQKHPEIPYKIKQMEFADKWAAIVWMCRNQLGRRNLSPIQAAKLMQEEHDALMHTHGSSDGFRGNQYLKVVSGENDHLPNDKESFFQARKVVADIHGIKESEVRANVEFGRGLDAAEKASPGIKQAVLSGEVKAPKQVIAGIRKLPEEKRPAAVEAIKRGDISEAKRLTKPEEHPLAPPPVTTQIEQRTEYDVDDFAQELALIVKDIDKGFKLLLTMAHKEMLNYEAGYEAALKALNDVRSVIARYEDFVREAFKS